MGSNPTSSLRGRCGFESRPARSNSTVVQVAWTPPSQGPDRVGTPNPGHAALREILGFPTALQLVLTSATGCLPFHPRAPGQGVSTSDLVAQAVERSPEKRQVQVRLLA